MSRSKNPESFLSVALETPLFTGLTEAEVKELLGRDGVSVSHYEKGAILYAPETFSKSVGFLTVGRASVTKAGGSGDMLMSILHAGELFGAATLFALRG